MVKKKTAALTSQDQARYQQMADRAENETIPAAQPGAVRHGTDAAHHARALLVDASMDPAELSSLIGGWPNLDPDAAPGSSPA